MGKIIRLDESISNKINAGEVVERPASVVKELVENSLDANSTVIEIHLEEAGLSKIQVIDNGDGIEEDDVLTAFERHATSKIKNEEDLFRIRTLGFRGEALPSIASVSKLELTTSTGDMGTRIVVEGGEVKIVEKAPCRKGTDITVTDIFYNTPARLKYMKTIHTELGNITDIVNRIALSHPDVSFRVIHNGRKLLQTSGNGDVRQVLAAIYGMNVVKKMIPIEGESLDFTITGWASLPEVTRASRNYISTMINGRFIKNYSLVKAIQEGYHTLLPIGRYPIVLLHVKMDPQIVDVNVHPSKLEVRFSKEKELNELVTEMIKNAFKKEQLIPSGVHQKPKVKKSEQVAFFLDHLPPVERNDEPMKVKEDSLVVSEKKEITPTLNRQAKSENSISIFEKDHSVVEEEKKTVEKVGQEVQVEELEKLFDDAEVSEPEEIIKEEVVRVPPLYPIGQMHGTYILAQNEKGLYIIDQHAAQERIKYEFFKEKVGEVANELQEMLVPLTFEFSTDEYIKINECKALLEEVGVFLEPFGHHCFIVRSHPQWFPKGEEKEIIEGMIEQVLQMRKVDIKKLREEAAIMMSCKRSIKANQYLQINEIQNLLDDLRQTSDPFTCPHGRPIIIHFSSYELEKMFKRVM